MKKQKQIGVWIDGSKAIIVSLDNGLETISEVQSEIENRRKHQHEGDPGSLGGSVNGANGAITGQRKLDNSKKFFERRLNQQKAFLEKVVKMLGTEIGGIYLLGSGQTKLHLRKTLEEIPAMANCIAGFETCDKLTMNQLVQKVKHFYQTVRPDPHSGTNHIL